MNLDRFCIKFFTQPESQLEDESALIPIFHDWIRLKKLDQVCIDVADYRHVPEGPGVMLVTHEINYAMDHGDGQFGLSAQRKLGPEESQRDRILGLVRSTAKFGALLESDSRVSGQVKFEGGTFHYIANDRLHAPNSEESFAELRPELEAAAAVLYPGQSVSLTRLESDARDRLTVVVKAEKPVSINTLATA